MGEPGGNSRPRGENLLAAFVAVAPFLEALGERVQLDVAAGLVGLIGFAGIARRMEDSLQPRADVQLRRPRFDPPEVVERPGFRPAPLITLDLACGDGEIGEAPQIVLIRLGEPREGSAAARMGTITGGS